MRSRDGDRTLLCRFCALILFGMFTLAEGSEYLVSYRYVTQDAKLLNESLQVSHAMKKCSNELFDLPALYLNAQPHEDLRTILLRRFDLFFDYIQKLGLHVVHRDHLLNRQTTSITSLTLKTTCFKVEFNDSFVIIQALKER